MFELRGDGNPYKCENIKDTSIDARRRYVRLYKSKNKDIKRILKNGKAGGLRIVEMRAGSIFKGKGKVV